MTAEKSHKAEVFKRPVQLRHEDSEGRLIDTVSGVVVGTERNGTQIYSKCVYPVFISYKPIDGKRIPKPLYGQRIARAEKKAKNLALKLG